MEKTKRLTEGAVMLALAAILSTFAVYKLPNGGSITFASCAPIIIFSLRHGAKQGTLVAFCYAILQMILGFYPPPVNSFLMFSLVVILDYIVAYTVLGIAPLFYEKFGKNTSAIVAAVTIPLIVRLIAHFLSGILVWASYAPDGQPVWLYSLTYNSSYMIGEIVITTTALIFAYRYGFMERKA